MSDIRHLEEGATANDDDVPTKSNTIQRGRGHLDAVGLLFRAGARVNCGEGCLLEPSRNGRDDLIRILLEAGEDPNVAGENWETPLSLALAHTSTVALLKSHAAIIRILSSLEPIFCSISENLSGLGVQNPRPWEISWASGGVFSILSSLSGKY